MNRKKAGVVSLYESTSYYDPVLKQSIGSGDKVHYAKVKAVDMNLSLYKYDTYSIQTIVNWYPDDPQWWITGFSGARKEFRHPREKRLFVIGRVKLGKIEE